ncbi:MAG: XdhC family protein [Spirochaetota bacterium]
MEFYEIIAEMEERGFPLVLAHVVGVAGSAPRHLGSAMAVWPDGTTLGSVGGGQVEAKALEAAGECFALGRSATLKAFMHGGSSQGIEPICGGAVEILAEYLKEPGAYGSALSILSRGGSAVLVLDTGDGPGGDLGIKAAEEAGKPCPPGLDAAAFETAARGRIVRSAVDGWLYLGTRPREKLLILGGGYVGKALAEASLPLGFSVTVADFRREFADPARFSGRISVIHKPFEAAIGDFPFDPSTYAVVVSPDHAQDLECVRAILAKPFKYAGFIGSKRKVRLVLSTLREEGLPEEKIAALCAPIGLDIGAETPEEIAVSILAQIIAFRRGSAAAKNCAMPAG